MGYQIPALDPWRLHEVGADPSVPTKNFEMSEQPLAKTPKDSATELQLHERDVDQLGKVHEDHAQVKAKTLNRGDSISLLGPCEP